VCNADYRSRFSDTDSITVIDSGYFRILETIQSDGIAPDPHFLPDPEQFLLEIFLVEICFKKYIHEPKT
jgi:hypothetical protein